MNGVVAPTSPADRDARFLALSAALTGIGPVTLAGTGQTETYLRLLDGLLPAGLLDAMIARCAPRAAGSDDAAADAETGADAAIAALLGDRCWGPVAQRLILLWYRGSWIQLPADWRATHGASPQDSNRLVSGDAYRAGLQWRVAGAHASGADPQGFGAWALPPARALLP